LIEDNYYFYYFNGAPSVQDIVDMEAESELEEEINQDTSECYCVEVQDQIEPNIE
jgi:hypothetical protein